MRSRRTPTWRFVLAGLVVVLFVGRAVERDLMGRFGSNADCTGLGAQIEVVAARHRLTLCSGGRRHVSFGIRLGRNGIGKTREGDGKTPVGRYRLLAPRRSNAFGTFVGIDYPTPAQRKRGFSGSAIGMHGPRRELAWAGPLNVAFDTTSGCIGLASDEAMREITRWLRRHPNATVAIR